MTDVYTSPKTVQVHIMAIHDDHVVLSLPINTDHEATVFHRKDLEEHNYKVVLKENVWISIYRNKRGALVCDVVPKPRVKTSDKGASNGEVK